VPKTQVPQVVDRSAARRLKVDVRSGPAFEALLALLILNGGPPFDRYERGDEIARFAKRRMPGSVDRAVTQLRTPTGDHWSALLGVIASGEPPYDVTTVLDRLKRMNPTALKLGMLGLHRVPLETRRDLNPEVFRAAANGDKVAVADLLITAERGGWAAEVAPLIQIDAAELATLVISAIADLPPELFLAGNDPVGLLERNSLEAEKLLAEADDIAPVIEQLTGGLVYRPEPGVDRALLIPTLVHRPWTLVLDHEQTKLFCYPARLEDELSAPDRGLIRLYRALGDGTRLRILRRLAVGTATVGRISEELGLAKSTVHEHLLSLRAAGLVRLPASGGFELEPELPDLNWMLKDFLGLEMRRQCETCGTPLEADGVAYICSYECTFCSNCTEIHGGKCPNCAGELVLRPRRTVTRPQPRRNAGGHGARQHSLRS
jgi:hypothetical protein